MGTPGTAQVNNEQILNSLAPANTLTSAQPEALSSLAADKAQLRAIGGKEQPTVPLPTIFDKAGPATPEVPREFVNLPLIGKTGKPGEAPTPIKIRSSPFSSTFGADFDPEATQVSQAAPRTGLGLNFPAPQISPESIPDPQGKTVLPEAVPTPEPFVATPLADDGSDSFADFVPTSSLRAGAGSEGFSLADVLSAVGPSETGFGSLATLGLGSAVVAQNEAQRGLPLRREIRAGEEARAGAESAAGLEKTQAEIELLGAQTGAATAKAVKDLSGGDTKIKFTKSRPDPFGVGADVPGSVEFAGRKHDISVEEEARLDQDIAVGLQMLQESGQGSGNPDKDLEDITRQVTRRMLMARGA